MPAIYNDVVFTVDGDLQLGETGDLLDTDQASTKDPIYPLKQTIIHRLIAEEYAWQLHPDLCAGLERFMGRSIDSTLLRHLEQQVAETLSFDGTVPRAQVFVQALDLSSATEAVVLTVFLRHISDKPITMMIIDSQVGGVSQVR